jgi:two-component system cell cycle sensor histidine kinase/response regulator CckA
VASKSPLVLVSDFERLPVAGLVLEVDGTLVAANAAATRLFGLGEDAVGQKGWEVIPGLRAGWDALIADARERGSASTSFALDTRAIDLTATLRDNGRTVVFGLAIDVTHHKLAGEAQARADMDSKQRLESLGLVAGGIAHDFNNQLVSVLAEASAAREDDSLTDTTREALRRIEGAAKRMAQLTRQLLAYAGRGRFVTELTDPDELLDQEREQLERIVNKGASLLEIAPGAGTIAIEADRSLLRQVITNLVSNASDALPEGGGTVRITSRLVSRAGVPWWQMEVSDDGSGMDAKTLARIFDPFFTTKVNHHGLGLSAVHGIVRRLGGDIEVDSQTGKGARFRVRLPVVPGAEAKRKRSTSKQTPIPGVKGMRVLVADDESTVRSTVRRLLERRGATVVTANDGLEAQARMREEAFALVLFDVMMPGLSGYELLPIARKLQPHAAVMLMSGFTERSRADSEDEPDIFLEKPFSTKTLDKAIEELLKDRE